MATYPKREPFFGIKAIRRMVKACVIQEIGDKAFALLTVIASCEDAKRYTGPVTYYNDQLLPLLGTRKWDTLAKVRREAVTSGWLHYESGGTQKPGRYWITIPKHLQKLDDTPTDEGGLPPATGDNVEDYPLSTDTTNGSLSPLNGYNTGDNTGYNTGDKGGDNRGDLSSLPKPKPKERARVFVPPSVAAIQTYASEANLPDLAARFSDYHQAREWKLKGQAEPMADWKAAYRGWCALEKGFNPPEVEPLIVPKLSDYPEGGEP